MCFTPIRPPSAQGEGFTHLEDVIAGEPRCSCRWPIIGVMDYNGYLIGFWIWDWMGFFEVSCDLYELDTTYTVNCCHMWVSNMRYIPTTDDGLQREIMIVTL